jgi:hypothetical protein
MTLLISNSENMHQLISDESYSDVTLINVTTRHVTVLHLFISNLTFNISESKNQSKRRPIKIKFENNVDGSSVV